MAEHTSFRFDWNEVEGAQIAAILGLDAMTLSDGSAQWDAVAICIGETAVMVTVEPDTDQVIISREVPPCGEGWQSIASFDFAVGKTLGWSWIGINSQGYKDALTVAFGPGPDSIWPRCTFVAAASSLTVFDLVARSA
ncbi:MAG: DUF6334 family protein [Sphingomonas sp.]